ncbi:MAG: right-handed parallel beta-helix repeat-containing protein, partial [Thermoplasmata archaeon]|nr:right-handed parallel beta-helix repeat-containing protein [Thermoplasmata archaeon]
MIPMKNIHKILLALVFLLAGIMVLVLTAQQAGAAKTITVDDDGGAYYTKIQDAVNVSEDGDTIRVYEGTYYENIVVNKSVSLIGNSSANTTIDGRGDEDVVQITADWVKMSGFMVTRSGSGWDDAGIKVESDHNNIFENTCSDNYNGIYLYRSDSNTLNNNTCSNNGDDGISLWDSVNNTLNNNTCSNNYYGIHLWDSVNNTLNNNTCSDNGYGISLSDSDGNTLNNNTCNSNNYYSISLGDSAHNSLSNNKMIENGIFIRGNSIKHWNTQIIDTTNTVNGKPLCYYKNATGFTVPSGAGQVILANCTEMVVENQNLSNGSIGIQLGFSS